MPVGYCPLCQFGGKELVDSHFFPAASYKPVYGKDLSVNEPMIVTNKRVIQSSRQITAHAFCSDCEDRFNKGGESWVIGKLATLSEFPLREMVLKSPPIHDEPDFKAFSCGRIPELRSEKIIHFAVGMFWKAAARTWNMVDGSVPQLELGPYEEPIRKFVHGSGPFPRHLCLIVFLDSKTPPVIALTPPQRFAHEQCHLFGFYINGAQCWLCVGKSAPACFQASCIATGRDHAIFVLPDAGKSMFAIVKEAAKTSVPSRGVMRTFEQWKSSKGNK